MALDVCDEAQINITVSFVEKEYGAIFILVNNAGITRDNLAMRMKDEEWDAVIDTNLKAVFRMSRAVMRGMMKARAGRIINISSVVGYAGNPGQANSKRLQTEERDDCVEDSIYQTRYGCCQV